MLARARQHRSQLTALLMDRQTFQQHTAANAVTEAVGAGEKPPDALDEEEQNLYRDLLTYKRGRLEQEYLPVELVREVLEGWVIQLE